MEALGICRSRIEGVTVLEDPLRGVDIGAKAAIHELVRQLAADGRAMVVRPTELPDCGNVWDRVDVFPGGLVVGERPAPGLTDQPLLDAINTGIVPDWAAAT